jgi:integrase
LNDDDLLARLPPEERARVMIDRLLNYVSSIDLAFHAYLSLAVSTGARRSQITALRLGEVDLENGQIGFIQALLDAKGGPVLCPTKTKRTYRVDLDVNCLEVLTAHVARAKARAEAAGVQLDRSSFVFSDDPAGATPWKPNWVTKQFIKYRTVVKVDCRLHDLRHFMATTFHRRCPDRDGLRTPQPRANINDPERLCPCGSRRRCDRCRGPQLRSPGSRQRVKDAARSAPFPSPICRMVGRQQPSKSSTRFPFSK